MIQVCCIIPKTDFNDLCYEDKQKFGYMVNQLRKQGRNLKKAQELAYQRVTCDSMPFEPEGGDIPASTATKY